MCQALSDAPEMSSLGVLLGLGTAVLWTLTAVCFESASRRLGSFNVNVLRLLLACLMFLGLSLVRSGDLLPEGLTSRMWWDLVLSGIIGFVLGDVLLFEAFVLIGARLSMLIYACVPTITALAAFVWMGENITFRAGLGMLVTTLGIATAVQGGARPDPNHATRERSAGAVQPGQRTNGWNRRTRGILFALGGSLGQSAGLLLSKRGSLGIDAFAATEVRVLAGCGGFVVLALVTRRLAGIVAVLRCAFARFASTDSGVIACQPVTARTCPPLPGRDPLDPRRLRGALWILCCGAVLGPFLGVSLGLRSVQLLPAGVASTLMSIVPALLVPVSAVAFRERVRQLELVGTAATLVGVALLSL